MLRRVRIRGYKSLRDVEVRFDRPLSIIIGANASGKSNLFDALALLSQLVIKPNVPEAFKDHRGSHLEAFSFDEEGIEGLLDKRFAEFSIEVDFELSLETIKKVKENYLTFLHKNGSSSVPQQEERLLRYSVTVRVDTFRGFPFIASERFSTLNTTFTEKNIIAERDPSSLKINVEGFQASGVYTTSSQSTLFSFSMFLDAYVIRAAWQEIKDWRFYDLDPKAMRPEVPLNSTVSLEPNGANLAAFFNTMKIDQPKQLESIRRALRLLIPEIEIFEVKRSPDGYLHLSVREGGAEYSSRVISDGTLRVLALLAATNPLDPATLLGIEEPENGVHPRRLQLIASLLRNAAQEKGTQVLVNTHSPLLPQYFPEDDLIVCRRIDGETVFEHLDTSSRKPADIEQHLNDEEPTSITDRIVRGDYGG